VYIRHRRKIYSPPGEIRWRAFRSGDVEQTVVLLPKTSGGILMLWKECPGFPDYAISELGHVKRVTPAIGARVGRLASPFMRDGYVKYTLRRNGKPFNVAAHRLVALAFIGPPPFVGAEACHNDGVKLHNNSENIRWDTRKNNVADTVAHGTSLRKLTADGVRIIRSMMDCGVNHCQIARKFSVHKSTIWKISRGMTWTGVR
jgi:hypothetical protein